MFLPNSSTTMKCFEKKKIIFAFFGIFFRSLKSILITGLLGLIFLFIVIPSIFRWSTVVQRQMVFLPWGKHISLLDNAPNQLGSWVHYPKESKHFFKIVLCVHYYNDFSKRIFLKKNNITYLQLHVLRFEDFRPKNKIRIF